MTIQLDIDKQVLADIEEAISFLKEDREDVFRETFAELAKKKKREAEVAKQYADAYRKDPVRVEEFEVEEEQLIEAWKEL